MEWLVRDIQAAASLLIATPSEIKVADPEEQYLRYNWDSAAQTITLQECSGDEHLLAEGITQFTLKYYDVNNVEVADPITDVADVKAIDIDITVEENEREFSLNTVARFNYTTLYDVWLKSYATNLTGYTRGNDFI